jgi:flagellar hook assembly protein FlgD
MLPQSSHVDLAVYDVAGRRVATLFAGLKGAGDHSVQWNGVGDDGHRVSAGIYFCRIQAGNTSVTRKLVVMR